MKVRTGFVSNSSSSSFLLAFAKLTAKQVKQIRNHHAIALEQYEDHTDMDACTLTHNLGYLNPEWIVKKSGPFLYCGTTMDNFDMGKYLKLIKADKAIIAKWHSNHRFRRHVVLDELDHKYINKPTAAERKESMRLWQKYAADVRKRYQGDA